MIIEKPIYFKAKNPICKIKPILYEYDSGEETGYHISEDSELYNENWINVTRFDDHNRPYGNVPKLNHVGYKTNYSLIRLAKRAFDEEFHPYDYYAGLQIDHINPSIPLDNNISNLEWVTGAENMRRAGATGVMIKKYRKDLIHEICKMICEGKPRWFIKKELGVNAQLIDDIRSGRSHKSVSEQYLDKGFEYKIYDRKKEEQLVHKICRLIEDGLRDCDISRQLKVDDSKVNMIRHHYIFKNISSGYNF